MLLIDPLDCVRYYNYYVVLTIMIIVDKLMEIDKLITSQYTYYICAYYTSFASL